jgi:hypothetical protein
MPAGIERRKRSAMTDIDDHPDPVAVSDDIDTEHREADVDSLRAADADVIHQVVRQHEGP